MVSRDLLVVCPAFNEEQSVADVVADVRRSVPGADVVVVDDGSSDATALVARSAGARVLQLPFNIGVGGALRTGLLLARREGYAAVVQCDSDGQHPASAIDGLVRALDSADLVIGTRWGGVGDYVARGPRRWAMVALSRVLSRVHHTPLSDVTSGFRAFGPRAVAVLADEMPPEYLGDTLDALVIARVRGLVVAQVPVRMRERTGGVPSHRTFRSTLYLLRATLVLSLSLVRLAPTRGARRRHLA